MKNLTANPVIFPAQRTPENSDPALGTGLEECFQRSADRTGYLDAQRALMLAAYAGNGVSTDAHSGVLRLRTVASLSALRALSGMANGEVALVTLSGLGSHHMVFMFSTSFVEATNGNWYQAPAGGGGTWVNVLTPLVNPFGGTSGTDTRLSSVVPVPNRIVSVTATLIAASTLVANSSGYLDTDLITPAVTVQAGDKVKIEVPTQFYTDTNDTVLIDMVAHNGITAATISGTLHNFATISLGISQAYSMVALHEPGSAGTYTYRVRGRCLIDNTTLFFRATNLIVTVVRPLRTAERQVCVYGTSHIEEAGRRLASALDVVRQATFAWPAALKLHTRPPARRRYASALARLPRRASRALLHLAAPCISGPAGHA